MYKKSTKIIASILVLMLTATHFNILGTVLASTLESQSLLTNNNNITFDAYFMEENKKVHTTEKTIGAENYLNTAFSVKEAGYLKNAIVEVVDANFKLDKIENGKIAKVEENKIYFNQINKEEPLEIAIPIKAVQENEILLQDLSKESIVKLTATYVNKEGKEKQIEKEIKVHLSWTAEKQAELSMQIAKFIPYNVNGNKGLVLQTMVQSYLVGNTLPVKQNKIEIEVPTINNIKPEEIKVSASTTKATNNNENFSEENYKYDKESNKLTIIVENNENEQGKIAWNKEVQDEFIVTYVYKEEALDSIAEEGVKVAITAKSELTVYEQSYTKVSKEFVGEVTLKDQISNLVDFYVKSNNLEMSKGQIYANYETENKIENEYQEILVANIGIAELTDKVILEQKADNFITNEETKILAKQTYNKEIKISKQEVTKILGEDAKINFYVGNTQIATINNETQVDEQGNYIINIAELNTNTLTIETSKPQTEGNLNFIITKAIKGEIGYSKEQITNISKLEQNVVGKAVNGNTNFVEQEVRKSNYFNRA